MPQQIILVDGVVVGAGEVRHLPDAVGVKSLTSLLFGARHHAQFGAGHHRPSIPPGVTALRGAWQVPNRGRALQAARLDHATAGAMRAESGTRTD